MATKTSNFSIVPQSLTLWRISTYEMLDGIGAFRRGGRWNSPGSHVVYLAETPAGAMLETIVHLALDKMDLPDTYRLMQIEIKFEARPAVAELELLSDSRWQANSSITQAIGDAWLKANETVLARVPSVIMPHTWNYLLNPLHAVAGKARVVASSEHLYDPRLLRVR